MKNKKLIPLFFGIFLFISLASAMPFIPYSQSAQFSQVNLQGLQKAISVANPNATAQLQSNLQRLNQTDLNILNTLNNLTITNQIDGSANMTGTYPALLLGFIPLQHSYNYQLNSNGTLSKKPGFFDFLWKDEANL